MSEPPPGPPRIAGSSPLRVLLLAPTQVVGGITTWARLVLRYSDPAKVEYRIVPTDKLYDALGQKPGLRGAVLGLRDAAARWWRLRSEVREFRPHVVYITTSPNMGLVVRDVPYMRWLRWKGVPVLAHLHGGDVNGFFGRRGPRRWLSVWGLKACDRVLVLNRKVEEAAKALLPPGKVRIFPNMHDESAISPTAQRQPRPAMDDSPMRLLHVAWQAPAKGTLELVEAMRHVRRAAECDLVGAVSDDNRRLIEARIQERGVAGRIRLVGRKTGDDLRRAFESADLFVFPSHSEGSPMVVLEAMAYGLPVLSTDVGNVRDVLGADTAEPAGVLLDGAPPVDPLALAREIDRLLGDVDLRRRLSRNALRRIQLYTSGRLVGELESLLREWFAPRGEGPGQPST
jgi:glycosyltransferase involved in cell wall biosynthesis